MANPTQADVDRAVAAAHSLEQQGYFAKVKTGDVKAASYFARLVASMANPSGMGTDWGWLSKPPGGGTQVEGYADGAIVFGNNPNDLVNVLKIVTQVGSTDPNAIQIGRAVQDRRPSDTWHKPVPVPPKLPTYLAGGVPPTPQPPQTQPPGREEALDELNWLDSYYAAPEGLQRPNGLSLNGKPDFEGVAAWYLDVYQRERMAEKSRADSRAAYVSQIRHSDEWKQKHPGETP